MKLNCPLEEQRKTGPLLALLSHQEGKVCFRALQYTHLARQNRSFEGTATKREKRQDWMAERVGFEPTVEFPQHTLSKRAP